MTKPPIPFIKVPEANPAFEPPPDTPLFSNSSSRAEELPTENRSPAAAEAADREAYLAGWHLATFRRRSMARMIDYFVLIFCTETILFVLQILILPLNPSPTVLALVVIVFGYIVSNALFFAWDWSWTALSGATLGKWIYGLRVTCVQESTVSSRQSAIRSHALLRWLLYLFCYPLVTFWLTGTAERQFGKTGTTTWDLKAGTMVVAKKIGVMRLIFAIGLSVLSCLGLILLSAFSTASFRELFSQ